ncbi:hypothetical protein GGF32_001878 [Allomyces javanicus]|nr:hypothetical protein GGF32_001878 [Allomyces javanicus]
MRPDNQANVFATRAVQALAAPAAALYDRRLLQATSPRPLLATFIHLAAMARTCSAAQLLQLVHDGAIDRAVDLIKQALPDGATDISATAVRMGLAKIEAMPSIAPDGALWLAALQLLAVVATRGDARVRAECARRGAVGACVLVLRQFLRALERAAVMQQQRAVAGVGSKRPLDDRDEVADDRDQDAGGVADHDMHMQDDSMRKKTDRKCTMPKHHAGGANGHAAATAADAAHQIRARTVAPSPLKRQCVGSVASATVGSAATRVALVATTSFNLSRGVRAVGGDGGRAIEGGAYTTRLPQPGTPTSAARAPAGAALPLAEALPLVVSAAEGELDGSPSPSPLRIIPQPIIISPRPLSPASASLSLPGAAPAVPTPGMGHVDALLALQVIQVLAENPTVRAYLRQPQGLAQQQLQQQQQQPAPPNAAVGAQLCAFALVEPFTRLPIAPLRDVAVQIMRQAAAAGAVNVNAGKCSDASCRTPTTTTTPTTPTTPTTLYACSNLTCARVECTDGEFARCGRCRAARYCSRACQAASWTRGHRHWCAGTACDDAPVGKPVPTGAAAQASRVWQQREEREEEEEKEKDVESRISAAAAGSRTASAAASESMVVDSVVDNVRRVAVVPVGPIAGVVAARVHGGHHHSHHHHHGHVVLGGTRFGMPVSFRTTVPAAPVSPVLVANLGMPKHTTGAATVVPTMAL